MSDNTETTNSQTKVKKLPLPAPKSKEEKEAEKQVKKNSIDFYIESRLPEKPKVQKYTKLDDGTVVRLNKNGQPDKRCGPNGVGIQNLKKSIETKVKEAIQTVKKQDYDDDDESDSSESDDEEYEIAPKKKPEPKPEPQPQPQAEPLPDLKPDVAIEYQKPPVPEPRGEPLVGEQTPKVDYDEYLRLKKEREQLEEVKKQNELLKKQFNFNEHLNRLHRLSQNVKIKF